MAALTFDAFLGRKWIKWGLWKKMGTKVPKWGPMWEQWYIAQWTQCTRKKAIYKVLTSWLDKIYLWSVLKRLEKANVPHPRPEALQVIIGGQLRPNRRRAKMLHWEWSRVKANVTELCKTVESLPKIWIENSESKTSRVVLWYHCVHNAKDSQRHKVKSVMSSRGPKGQKLETLNDYFY